MPAICRRDSFSWKAKMPSAVTASIVATLYVGYATTAGTVPSALIKNREQKKLGIPRSSP